MPLKLVPIAWLFLLSAAASPARGQQPRQHLVFYRADRPEIQFVGRIDFTRPGLPRCWSPGVYFATGFSGTSCGIILHDEMPGVHTHNYVEIVIDQRPPERRRLQSTRDTIWTSGLPAGPHTLTVCKNTESGIGYLELGGFLCEELLPVPPLPGRSIECIGNSITCGTGSDQSEIPCRKGVWEDQHNAYMSYGPVAARTLHARWVLTAVSGIGLIHSCCGIGILMPEVVDKVDLRKDSISWNFASYQPDVLTICLGQNDGIQDSTLFCDAYVRFLKQMRLRYPNTAIVCLTSPMADEKLTAVMKNYISSVVKIRHEQEDNQVSAYFFSTRYYHGCDMHPDLAEHQQIAAELSEYLRKLMKWAP